jgi:uncharacterized protein YfaS (alpha-2-macroglobulin family)
LVADTTASFSVQTYKKDSIVVNTQFTQTEYNPGDTIIGIVRISNITGDAF